MGLLRFIFITIIVLWVIRLLVRLILPSMVRSAFGGNPNQQQAHQQQNYNSKSEGTISILSSPKKEKKGNSDKLGEFVDYEEVK